MKKQKRLMCALLAVVCVLALTVQVSATAGNVHYSGSAREFIFNPGSEYSPTDLFVNFKDIMPGDSLSQQIQITNDVANDVKIKIYMRALGAQEGSEAFLSQMQLRVELLPETVLFEAAADQTAQLTEWKYLGTLYSGGEAELNVILDVPVSMDNTNKNLIGYLDWEFMVEEYPVEESDPKPPQTGDYSNGGLFTVLMIGSGLLLVILLILLLRKKKKDEEK